MVLAIVIFQGLVFLGMIFILRQFMKGHVSGAVGHLQKLNDDLMKQQAELQQGLSSEKAKDITKAIKDLGLKVQPRIDGDAVRVSGRQIDDLQAVIQALRAKDFGVPIQVENLR